MLPGRTTSLRPSPRVGEVTETVGTAIASVSFSREAAALAREARPQATIASKATAREGKYSLRFMASSGPVRPPAAGRARG
jgi:hypothetical protein